MMSYSNLSSLLIIIGIVILVYPITVINLHFEIQELLFRLTLGVGSALFGAGIGFGIGHFTYKKEKVGTIDD